MTKLDPVNVEIIHCNGAIDCHGKGLLGVMNKVQCGEVGCPRPSVRSSR